MSAVFFSPVVLGLAATLVVLFLMTRGRKTMMRVCITVAVPAFFGGLALYTVGYMPQGGGTGDVLTAMLRGLFSTGRMFLINDDYGFLLDDPAKAWLTGSIAFQVVFWLCHVLALVVTISTVMSLFGYRLINAMRLRLRRYDSCTIICGCGGNALALGENVATHDGARDKPDPKRLVVYLVPEVTDEMYETLASWGAIPAEYDKTNFATRLRRVGLGAKAWRIRRFRVVLMPAAEAEAMTLLEQTLQAAAGLNLPAGRLSIHLLSENDWVRQYVQSSAGLAGANWPIHMAGEAELAARRMILAQPPCLALPFEKGVARQDLVVLVLGFGKTGAQALRRLIVNGQFVGSRMRAIVVDKEIESLRGGFEQAYPGFGLQDGDESRCREIEYHALDVRSEAFFALLDSAGGQINYVVAALNDDCLNLETGQAVATHYRRNGRPQPCMALAISAGGGAGSETDRVVFFSRQADMYSEATVIREKTDAMAMAVNYAYVESSEGPPAETRQQLWYRLDHFSRESSRAGADFIPTMLHLAGLTPAQAMAAGTLTEDEQLAETLAHTEHLRWNAFHYAMGYTPMDIPDMAQRFAELKLRGEPTAACRKDGARCRHACLVPWARLPAVSQALNDLLRAEGIAEERNFQKEDYAIIRSIPLSIRVAEGHAGEEAADAG